MADPAGLKVRYVYRLRPGAVAESVLLAEWGRCRWVWNQCVTAGKAGSFLGDKHLTAARKNLEWLADGSQNVQQQMLRQYRAKKAKGGGSRRLKKKHARASLNYTRNGFSIKNGRLILAGGISMPVVWSRDLPSVPSSVRVYQDSLGHWYASFVVQVQDEALPTTGRCIGIDWGVTTIATTTDPDFDLPATQPGKRNAVKLARYRRMMARRARPRNQSPSRGYEQAKALRAKSEKKVARQRQHDARVWARNVVANHDAIAVEDFKPTFLAKSSMARKAADNALAATKTELISIASRAGRNVVIVPPAYTTMTCSNCGTRAKDCLPLSQRTFACSGCGYTADRDRNAAQVILNLAGLDQAGVDGVRPPRPSDVTAA